LPDFFELLELTAKSDNIKLDAFSSTKKDKEFGIIIVRIESVI